MNITVILRQVPDTEADIMVNPADPTTILDDDIKWVMNPYDEFAVEAAVELSEDNDGEVTVICIGTDDAEQVLRTAMAMGADKGILISDEDAVTLDVISQAKVIAAELSEESPDLILCGREFIDTNEDALGAALAEFLDMPHVLNVSSLDLQDGTLLLEREIDGGNLKIEMGIPGVVSCQKGLNEPRYPNLMAVRRARKKPLETKELSDINIEGLETGAKLVQLLTPPERAEGIVTEAEPAEAVNQAIQWLQNDAKAF